jgi:hypothetical protein
MPVSKADAKDLGTTISQKHGLRGRLHVQFRVRRHVRFCVRLHVRSTSHIELHPKLHSPVICIYIATEILCEIAHVNRP